MKTPDGHMRKMQHSQEVVVWEKCVALAVRPSVGEWLFLRICVDSLTPEQLSVAQYLQFKERITGAFSRVSLGYQLAGVRTQGFGCAHRGARLVVEGAQMGACGDCRVQFPGFRV